MKKKDTSSGLLGWMTAFVLTAMVAGFSVFFVELGPDKKKKASAPPSSLPSLSPPPVPEEAPDLSSLLDEDGQEAEEGQEGEQKGQEPPVKAAESTKPAKSAESQAPNATASQNDSAAGEGTGAGTTSGKEVTAGVVGLEASFYLPIESEVATPLLERSAFCRNGKLARRAPSLFGAQGFAITYGAASFKGGEDPFPRLEIFINEIGGQRFASFMSLSIEKVPGFPNNQEKAILWDEKALLDVIFRWSKGASNGTCPVKKDAAEELLPNEE